MIKCNDNSKYQIISKTINKTVIITYGVKVMSSVQRFPLSHFLRHTENELIIPLFDYFLLMNGTCANSKNKLAI